MGDQLVVLGAGGHGRVVASTANAAGWMDVVFHDPHWPSLTSSGRWPVQGDGTDLTALVGQAVFVGIGDNERRLELLDLLVAHGCEPIALVHPAAWVAPDVDLGFGTFVGAKAVINSGATIGRGVIVNTSAVVEHDCSLAAGVHISPGGILAGKVIVGEGAWVGAGAVVRQGQNIGRHAIVGAGAAVVCDVPDGATFVGVPARSIWRSSN